MLSNRWLLQLGSGQPAPVGVHVCRGERLRQLLLPAQQVACQEGIQLRAALGCGQQLLCRCRLLAL